MTATLLQMMQCIKNDDGTAGTHAVAWQRMTMNLNSMMADVRSIRDNPPSSMNVQVGGGRKRHAGGNSNINHIMGKKVKK
jgi:hypothetical protein